MIARRHGLIFIDVDLGNAQAIGIAFRGLVQNRTDHLARTAPLSPVVDQHRSLRFEDLALEGGIGDVFDLAAHKDSLVRPDT